MYQSSLRIKTVERYGDKVHVFGVVRVISSSAELKVSIPSKIVWGDSMLVLHKTLTRIPLLSAESETVKHDLPAPGRAKQMQGEDY